MIQLDAAAIVRAYYDAFNARDEDGFLALLTDDVVHDINQGGREVGKPAFAAFMTRMNACYRERIEDLVILTDTSGTRAAAEFTVHGSYIKTDPGLPEAAGQTYVLPAGAFFTLRDGKVARISNFYNLQDWLSQVTGALA
ncbi:MAG: ketosteroid isomerase-related protein [Gammaproteobacteria bacterium]